MPIDQFHTDCYSAADDNQLEYMRAVADKVNPDFIFEADGNAVPVDSQAPFIFMRRYNRRQLYGRLSYEEYMRRSITNEETIQDIIHALGIDSEKFWYLLLFAYDYVVGCTQNTVALKHSPIEELGEFIAYVESNEQTCDTFNGVRHGKPMALTLGKEGQHKLVITNPVTISLIASICKEALPSLPVNSLLNSAKIDEENVSKSMSVRIWLFAEMFRCFFDRYPQFKNRRKSGDTVTKSTLMLISKLVYFVGLSDNEDYNTDSENLKAILKQYRNYRLNTLNRIY